MGGCGGGENVSISGGGGECCDGVVRWFGLGCVIWVEVGWMGRYWGWG